MTELLLIVCVFLCVIVAHIEQKRHKEVEHYKEKLRRANTKVLELTMEVAGNAKETGQ